MKEKTKQNITPEGDSGEKGVWSIHSYQKVSLKCFFRFMLKVVGLALGSGLDGNVRECESRLRGQGFKCESGLRGQGFKCEFGLREKGFICESGLRGQGFKCESGLREKGFKL